VKSLKAACFTVIVTVAISTVACGESLAAPAKAKSSVIEARQAQLMKDINYYQKIKALTDKQANKLRKALAKVARKKTKAKQKENAKVVDDETKSDLMVDLDEISADIKKFRDETSAAKAKAKASE